MTVTKRDEVIYHVNPSLNSRARLKSTIPQLDHHLKLWPQNSLPIAKSYMGLSKGFHSLKTKRCCLHALLQPRSRQWPSWEVAFANQMDRIWMCSWEMHMVHVSRNQGQNGREKGEPWGDGQPSVHCHILAWNSKPNFAFLVILKLCLSSWRINYILFTSLSAWLINI